MDLLFDARHIRQSGIGTYIGLLLPELEETFAERRLSLGVLVGGHAAPSLRATTTVLREQTVSPMYTIAEQRVWDQTVRSVRPRSLWVPHYPFPLTTLRPANRKMRLFVTVHDTMHVMDKTISGMSAARKYYARTMLTLDGRRSSIIFTPSQATVDTLAKIAPAARTCVTPIPVGDEWFDPAEPGLSPVTAPYVLYVGNAKWHKNLPFLMEAFGDVSGDVPHKLVIAGSGEALRGGDERVTRLAETMGDRVVVMGRLDFDVLRSLVAQADLLVMPSLHEGAGLPPIEAMASRTAVLASDIAALRETCGDGAAYFDPYDRRALAELLRRYCRDADATAELASRGRAYVESRQAGLSLRSAAEAVASDLSGHPPRGRD